MQRPALDLPSYRRLATFTMLASVAVTVAGLYQFLHGRWAPGVLYVMAGILLLLPSQVAQIRTVPGSENVLVFLTKKECSLCDEARLLLPEITKDTSFRIEETALETSSRTLRKTFRNRVPVLLWQGTVVAALRWDLAAIRARLAEIQEANASSVSTPTGESP